MLSFTRTPGFRSGALFFFVSLSLTLAAYAFHLGGDYIGDDTGRIEALTTLNLDVHPLRFMYNSLGDRPLLILSVYFDMEILGFGPLGMRVENIILFCFIALLLRILITNLARAFDFEISGVLRDLVLILVLVHPLNTQAVGNIIQRGILLSTLFGLISTLLLLQCRGNPRTLSWKVSLLVWCLALLSKPNVVFLPVWWGLMLHYLGEKKRIRFLFFFLLMLSIPVMGYVWGEFNSQSGGATTSSFTYFLTQGKAIARYLRLMVMPWPLFFLHDLTPSEPDEYAFHFALWCVYLSLLTALVLRSNNKGLKFFILGGALALVPESSFFPIIHIFFEHRTFVSLFLFAAGIVFFLSRYDHRILRGGVVTLILLAGVFTTLRSQEVARYEDWVLHEARPSLCQYPYFSFYIVNNLLVKNKTEAAREAFKRIGGGCPGDIGTEILREEFRLQDLPSIGYEDVKPLKALLHSNSLATCPVRNLSNSHFIKRVQGQEEDVCLIEDLISGQLRYLVAVYPECSMEVVRYKTNADSCLQHLQKTASGDSYRRLRIRTIQHVYFHEKDETLLEDLKAFPKTEEFEYLRGLIRKKSEALRARR